MKPDVTVLIANYNQKDKIADAIKSSINQKGFKTEVLVLDDQSTQKEVFEIYKKFGKRIVLVQMEKKGRIPLLNKAISIAKADFVCVSAGDCILEEKFLQKIMKRFRQDKPKKIAFVSPFSQTAGNCTVFRKKVLQEMKGFDESFTDGKTGFRDDTDLTFRIWDKGYETATTTEPKFKHEHKSPSGIKGKIQYAIARVLVHKFDALLFKKHPERAKAFLDLKLGFLRNPLSDFKTATGLWAKSEGIELSSPQGVKIIENNGIIHETLIIIAGVFYVVSVNIARVYGSIVYGTFLL